VNISILFLNIKSSDYVNEYDFILNEILGKYENKISHFLFSDEIETYEYDVLVYFCRNPTVEAHFGYAPEFETVFDVVNKINPKIIIQLGDEFWQECNDNHNILGNHCDLFLRQYFHWNQTYTKNTFQIPLGYITASPVDIGNIKPIKERKYSWSWSGHLKCDRSEMIQNFWNIWNHVISCNGGLTCSDIYQWYKDSIFVPIGRGNSSIDCYRIYEAIVCGAIPIIVCDEKEFETVFKYNYLLPVIRASSWNEASNLCSSLLNNNKDDLQTKQFELINWWKNTINFIQSKVENVLSQKKMSISVITACKNRNKPLEISLRSWIQFKEVSEIIIVDWSSDESLEYLAGWDERIKIISVQNQQYFNQPEPLNLAASLATGDYILKVDTDYILNPYFNFFDFYKVDNTCFVCGENEYIQPEINQSPYFKYLRGLLYVTRENFLKIGGFNENITKYYAYEDDEIDDRLELLGLEKKKVCYNHNIIHIPHPDKKRLENFEAYHTDTELTSQVYNSLSSQFSGDELQWQTEYVLAQEHIQKNKQQCFSEDKNYYFQSKIKWDIIQISNQFYIAEKL
jgi:GT2 family glycosyltransferase